MAFGVHRTLPRNLLYSGPLSRPVKIASSVPGRLAEMRMLELSPQIIAKFFFHHIYSRTSPTVQPPTSNPKAVFPSGSKGLSVVYSFILESASEWAFMRELLLFYPIFTCIVLFSVSCPLFNCLLLKKTTKQNQPSLQFSYLICKWSSLFGASALHTSISLVLKTSYPFLTHITQKNVNS